MRKLFLLLSVAALLPAAVLTTRRTPTQTIGFGPSVGTAGAANLTNTGGTSVLGAVSFVAPSNPFGGAMRLQDIRLHVSAVTASPQLTAKLYADNSGVPNTAGAVIESGTQSAALSIGWTTLSGFTVASNLTPGMEYWVVLVCTTGNALTIDYLSQSGIIGSPAYSTSLAVNVPVWGMAYLQSATNGTTWVNGARPSVIGFRVGLTDGTDTAYFGLPIYSYIGSNGTTEKVYTNVTAQEFGTSFTSPAVGLVVRSVSMVARMAGVPAGNLQYKLYTGAGAALAGTTGSIPSANVNNTTNGAYYVASFAVPITIPPNTLVRLTASDTAADSAAVNYYLYKYLIDTDANSLSLFPFGAQSTKLTAGSWLQVNSEIVPFWLYLEPGAEFVAATGAGGGSSAYVQ